MEPSTTVTDARTARTPSPLTREKPVFRPEYEYDSTPYCSSVSSTYSEPSGETEEWWVALFEVLVPEAESDDISGYLGDDEGAEDLSDDEIAEKGFGSLSGKRRHILWKLEIECVRLVVAHRKDLKRCRRDFPDDSDFRVERKVLRRRYDGHFDRLRELYSSDLEYLLRRNRRKREGAPLGPPRAERGPKWVVRPQTAADLVQRREDELASRPYLQVSYDTYEKPVPTTTTMTSVVVGF
ncbi:hypothetical protein BDV93DRAFT_510651 [Ceratobasidium sp. AG-I]|nr:hypothetical protein BDV93DRAFT_510651 [Ceratobasidium sp. AG-I]